MRVEPTIGPSVVPAPTIVVAVGASRTIREIAPLADRVESTFNAAATRGGALRPERVSEQGRAHFDALTTQAQPSAPTVPVGIFLTVACRDNEATDRLRATNALGIAGLAGAPAEVAATVVSLAVERIDRIQITPASGSTLELLAPHPPLARRA